MGVVGEPQKQSPEGDRKEARKEGRIRDHRGNVTITEEQQPVVATG